MEVVSESSTKPPFDHHESSESINDQLNSLSLQHESDSKTDTDNNADGDGMSSEERESDEKRENEVENVGQNSRFPVRRDAEDCSFYLRTGMCNFGMNCKFNHPPNRKFQGGKVKEKEENSDEGGTPHKLNEKEDDMGKVGQIECKYFDRPGGCKFGKACKFNHSRKTLAAPTVDLNFMGLPIRLGEKECPFYMRNGSCKFGAYCKFNHPDPTSLGRTNALPGHSNGGSILSPNASQSTLSPWSPPAALSGSPPYVPLMFPPHQGFPSQPEWSAYQASVYSPERSIHLPPAYATNGQSLERNVDEFPERPGEPECSYFLKTGYCKYRSACKFHHPNYAIAKSPSCTLSDLGLPLRPGESVCRYYDRYGICKYGPACKYDHPVYAYLAPLSTPLGLGNSMVNDHAVAPRI